MSDAPSPAPLDRPAAAPCADRPDLSIVIPAYNEQERLPATLQRWSEYLRAQPYSAEIIVVDDGSRDRTAEVTRAAMAQIPFLTLREEPHRGKGGAVRAGMQVARGRRILFADADLSMPPEELPLLLAPLDRGFDLAIASREGKGARRVGEPQLRHIMGRVFNFVVRLLAIPGLQDTQCGFKLFTAEAARELFRRQTIDDFGFDVEILYIARKLRYRVAEVPVAWYYQPSSRVNPLRDTIRMLLDILRVRWNDRRGRYR